MRYPCRLDCSTMPEGTHAAAGHPTEGRGDQSQEGLSSRTLLLTKGTRMVILSNKVINVHVCKLLVC